MAKYAPQSCDVTVYYSPRGGVIPVEYNVLFCHFCRIITPFFVLQHTIVVLQHPFFVLQHTYSRITTPFFVLLHTISRITTFFFVLLHAFGRITPYLHVLLHIFGRITTFYCPEHLITTSLFN